MPRGVTRASYQQFCRTNNVLPGTGSHSLSLTLVGLQLPTGRITKTAVDAATRQIEERESCIPINHFPETEWFSEATLISAHKS